MKKYIEYTITTLLFFVCFCAHSQKISVNHVLINPDVISGMLIRNISVINTSNEFKGQIKVLIYNMNKSRMVEAISNPVLIKNGMNVFNSSSMEVQSTYYADDRTSSFVKSFHKLPSGSYSYCVYILGDLSQEGANEYCDEVEVENDFGLSLVSPMDGETVEIKNPILIWTHTDPFSEATANQFYKINVVKKKEGQSNESAITSNPLLFSKSNLLSHNIYFPLDAPKLIEGNSYAWQVQKIANGKVVNQTEVWSFSIPSKDVDKSIKYAVLTSSGNSSTYQVKGGFFYFKFDEEYIANGIIDIRLFDQKHQSIPVTINNDEKNNLTEGVLKTGYNAFVLDIEKLNLKKGIYYLEVYNQKRERFNLNFNIE